METGDFILTIFDWFTSLPWWIGIPVLLILGMASAVNPDKFNNNLKKVADIHNSNMTEEEQDEAIQKLINKGK